MMSIKSSLNLWVISPVVCIILFAQFNILFGQIDSLAEKYDLLGAQYKKRAMPDSAIYYFKKAALDYKANGKTEKLISAYHQIGTLLTGKEKFEEARMYFGMADVQGQTLPDTNNLLRAVTFTGLGIIYVSVGDFKGALAYHKRALAIRMIKLGEYNADVATSYGHIGSVYLTMKNYDQSIDAYLKAMEIREKLFGKKSLEITLTYTNLGIVYREKKEYETALDYFQQALQNKVNHLGPEHKDLAKLYKSISDVYYLMGDKDQGDKCKIKADVILKN